MRITVDWYEKVTLSKTMTLNTVVSTVIAFKYAV